MWAGNKGLILKRNKITKRCSLLHRLWIQSFLVHYNQNPTCVLLTSVGPLNRTFTLI